MDEAQAQTTEQPAPQAPDAGTPTWVWGGGALLVVLVAAAILMRRGGAGTSTPVLEDREVVAEAERDVVAEVEAPPPEPVGLAQRLAERMGRTRDALASRFDTLLGRDRIDEDLLEDLEEILLIADVGVPTTERLVDAVHDDLKAGVDDPQALRATLRESARSLLAGVAASLEVPRDGDGPAVILVVGVNGSGKTTTIGKLAARLGREGRSVMLAAGDTYRAAAAEQLEVWAERAGAEIVRHDEGADPGAVVFDALDAARARGCDVVIVDTAGRLQTRKPLMEQLTKMRRVIDKKVPGAPHETLLVVDGTMGQNALSQAKHFHAATPLTGVVVTKLDGTAKGGMVLAIAAELGLPVKLIGIGEQIDDLRPFEVDAFVDALV